MSRITYTEKGNPSNNKDKTLPIASAPFKIRFLWALGNLFGINQIKRNAKFNRGFGIENDRPVKNDDGIGYVLNPDGTIKTEKRTYTSFNLGMWVLNRRNANPKRDIWYKRANYNGKYQHTPLSFRNKTMQMIRIPSRLV